MEQRVNSKMTDLFEQAHRDPELKRELLHNPREIAAKFGVEFDETETEHLQKLGALTDLAEEIKNGRLYPRPPIFYPIHVWQIKELMDIFTTVLPGNIGPGPIFYPAQEFDSQTVGFATRAFNPSWVSYPGDDPNGVGGGGGTIRWKFPGPIFYPASLRNFIKDRLVQILQVKQNITTR